MKDRGVIYAVYGDTHLARVCVSIASLREHYKGEITLFYKLSESKQMKDFVKKFKISTKPLKTDDPNLAKIEAMRKSKHQYNIYIDADTLIVKSIDPIFIRIKEFGIAIPNFMDFKPDDDFITDRMKVFRELEDLYKDAMEHPISVTAGVFGFTKGHAILEPLEEFTKVAIERKSRHACDVSLMLLCPQFDHFVMSAVNCMSSKYNNEGLLPRIIHYHGSRHVRDDCEYAKLWKDRYKQLKMRNNIPTGADIQLQKYIEATK